MECRLFKSKLCWDQKYASVHIDRWKPDIFCESTGIEICPPQSLAGRMMASQTIAAGIAGNVMGRDDPIPDAKIFHVGSGLNDFTGHFMAQYKRGSFDPVPFHDIAAADTARFHPHDQLSWAAIWP
jgi:hypothetical protein